MIEEAEVDVRLISRNCFQLIRDWKMENLANGKEISAALLRMEKKTLPSSAGSL